MNETYPSVLAGKYRVVRKLGQGGMGSVFEAVDPSGRHVAVKVMVTELASNQTLMGRFAREAQAAAAIDTPHIVKTLEAGADPQTGAPYMVMELLRGEDLDQVLKRLGALPIEVSLRIAAQACVALQKAHEQRVLHRDIKPANLFLAEDGPHSVVKLLDFGVAKVKPEVTRSNAETAGLTRTGSMLGSPLYMAPEQARGYKDIDFRADLWSLGVVLYKMLSGRTPHAETEELGELIILICTEAPEPIQDLAPWVPPEVAWIVHKALRLNSVERFTSAEEMRNAILALLPDGSDITPTMLRSLSDAERAVVAPRLQANLNDAPPPPRKGARTDAYTSSSNPNPAAVSWGGAATGPGTFGPTSAPMGGAMAPNAAYGATNGGTFGATVGPPASTTYPGTARGKSTGIWIGVGALLALSIGGFAAIKFANQNAAEPTPTAAEGPRTKPISVKVVLLPSAAKVEIEGQNVPVADGLFEISGVPGSVHKVKVSLGEISKVVEVVVTEAGASPPKIELPVPPAESSASADKPVATAAPTLTGKAKPKPTTTATPVFRGNR
ncbi:MAG: protein kinase [Polyangiaceae bacterium]|nr:protein kinase [Polyangiaceae bacterium]